MMRRAPMGGNEMRSSHIAVALAAATLSAAATWTVVAQTAAKPSTRTEILKQSLSDLPGREVRMLTLDLAPGDGSAPHRHPGHHVFGYIAEGSYEWKIDDQPARTFKAGDVFYEPPGILHAVSKNASPDARAKLVVFMIAD